MLELMIFIAGLCAGIVVYRLCIDRSGTIPHVHILPEVKYPYHENRYPTQIEIKQEKKRDFGFVVFDHDNGKVLFDGIIFSTNQDASDAALQWISTHKDSYSDKSVLQTIKVLNSYFP